MESNHHNPRSSAISEPIASGCFRRFRGLTGAQLTHGDKGPKVDLWSAVVSPFPSMKAKKVLAILERKPLGYRVARQSGSHRRMESPAYPPLTFAFHDKATIPAGLVRKILVRDVGLAEDEARKLL